MAHAVTPARPSKSSIKEKFLELYRVKPLSQISIRELADACNLSRSTFYFYFEDINALYKDCEQDALKYMESHLPDFVIYTVARNANRYIDSIVKHMQMLQLQANLFSCLLTGSESSSFRKQWFDMIYYNCQKTINCSNVTSPEERENLTRFFAAGKLDILTNWILSGCKQSPESVARISAQILFQGVYGQDIGSIN